MLCSLFQERVGIKAFGSDGSYYKLSALLKTSDRTKVVLDYGICFFSTQRYMSYMSCFSVLVGFFENKSINWESIFLNSLVLSKTMPSFISIKIAMLQYIQIAFQI
jgi:hypothetical protein